MDGIDMEELCKVVVIGAGGAVTVALTPAALVALGFTANGIAAGSIAAKLMSYFAIANGGGVFLQSIGAGGLTWSGTGILGSAGATAGWLLSAICNQTAATP
ncbi:interferon alpha-inducible protein 27-like protein 2A [Parambassis ranga]|uniref:Interferon alpha-inducible protein 27-like protein 2A n=1 Tax=Parambassis ranga TaxID=210632 RepID=A0A6P7HU96_9TELE|nr:interferon alpha-inducible protein 27-like protein 2A [Parambassis ranga]